MEQKRVVVSINAFSVLITYYSQNDEEMPTVTLKGGIDLNDLRKPENDGVLFEIEEEADLPEKEPTDNTYFDGEERCKNLYLPDEDSESDEDDDSSPFERLARKMEDICPLKDGGIMKLVSKHGSGPIVPPGSLVRVHFNGYFEYADEPFDSSRLQGRELRFRLGNGEVIEGKDVAVASMRKGECARFLIKSEYAYLSMGIPPRIPPNATVLFEIELIHFVEQAGLDDYFSMTEDEKREVEFSDVRKIYHSIVKEAKHLFQKNNIRQAFPKYKKACGLLENRRIKDEAEEKEQQVLLLRVYLNMALCCIKQCHSGRAISYCRKCHDIDKHNAKALYLHGKALHQLSDFESAKNFLKRAQRLKPTDRDVNAELEKVEQDMKNFQLIEKDMYKKMLSNPKEQTTDEKQAEDVRIEKAKSKSLHVGEGFTQLVRDKLQAFKGDKDLMEIPMPSYSLTVGEIECILETAESLELEAKVKGQGNNAQIRVLKKHPEVVS